MANYTDDFESYTPGSGLPTGWTSRWDTPTAWSVVDTSGDQSLKIEPTSNRCFASMDAINSDATRDNVEILARLKTSAVSAGNAYAHVVLRGSGTGTSETGYVCGIVGDDLRIGKYVSATFTEISLSGQTLSANTYYWVRFRANSTALKARIWADGGGEPGTWTIEVTDSSISSAGWAGCFSFLGGQSSQFSDVAIATNGDTASMSSSHTVAVGQASETDTAQSFGKQKLKAVGLATETETAQAITVAKRLAVGQASETDSAQALTIAKRVAVGLAQETDTAFDITVGGALGGVVGQASETDTAFAITAVKRKVIGYATEAEFAQAITAAKARGVLFAAETDTAQAITARKQIAVGMAIETDTAFAITLPSVAGQDNIFQGQRIMNQDEAYTVTLFMRSTTDHATGVTGATLSLSLSKAGSALSGISRTVTEIGMGWYSVALTSADTDTLGDLMLRATASGCDPTTMLAQVRDIAQEVLTAATAAPIAANIKQVNAVTITGGGIETTDEWRPA